MTISCKQTITLSIKDDDGEHSASLTMDGGLVGREVIQWLIGAFEALEFRVVAIELREALHD